MKSKYKDIWIVIETQKEKRRKDLERKKEEKKRNDMERKKEEKKKKER